MESQFLLLPPELFHKIFLLLGIQERARLSNASKSARTLTSQSWGMVSHLKFSNDHLKEKSKSVPEAILGSFWTSCSSSLLVLAFKTTCEDHFSLMTTGKILAVLQGAPPVNLKSLDVSALTHGGGTLVSLAAVLAGCLVVEILEFGTSLGMRLKDNRRTSVEGTREMGSEMCSLIKACPRLKSLTIAGLRFPLDFLSHLPPSMENLDLRPLFIYNRKMEKDHKPIYNALAASLPYLISQPLAELKSFLVLDVLPSGFQPNLLNRPQISKIPEKFPNLQVLVIKSPNNLLIEAVSPFLSVLAKLRLKMLNITDHFRVNSLSAVAERLFDAWTAEDSSLKDSLRSIILGDASLSGRTVRQIAKFPNLEEFSLGGYVLEYPITTSLPLYNSEDLSVAFSQMTALKSVSMIRNTLFDDLCVESLAKSCADLEFLYFTKWSYVSIEAIREMLVHLLLGHSSREKAPVTVYCHSNLEEGGLDFTSISHPSVLPCPHSCRVGGVFYRATSRLSSPDSFPCFFRPAHHPHLLLHTPRHFMQLVAAKDEKILKEKDATKE